MRPLLADIALILAASAAGAVLGQGGYVLTVAIWGPLWLYLGGSASRVPRLISAASFGSHHTMNSGEVTMAFATKPADTLVKLTATLIETAEAHQTAKDAAGLARSQEITALNAMNSAQRAFDAHITKMKQNAPAGSDWALEAVRAS